MSSIAPLGYKFNTLVSVTTAARRVSLRNVQGVTFTVVGASGATGLTISEANAATGGTNQTLAGSFVYYTMAAGVGVWVRQTAAVSGSINTIAAAGAELSVFVPAGALSDGFAYISASHATGTILYIGEGLAYQRYPQNLADWTV